MLATNLCDKMTPQTHIDTSPQFFIKLNYDMALATPSVWIVATGPLYAKTENKGHKNFGWTVNCVPHTIQW